MARTLRLDGNFVPRKGTGQATFDAPRRHTAKTAPHIRPVESYSWDLPPERKPRLRDRLIQFINSALMD
jgi:hypothetical protein